ncbi:MAG: tetratricopeptide repeat protein [Promethearchaeota archaeon]
MKLTNLTIKNLFTDDTKLTFLVGAGCSVDAPSCLPAGHDMIEAIIKYSCAEVEKSKILNLKELRFEQLVEIIRDTLDPKLKLVDYYGESDKPNAQHFFLAEMIKKGHFVITTNFDFLIEYALLQLGVPKKKVIPVITKNDFQKFDEPEKLSKKGKRPVYKIHGSTKNIIAGEDTKDSLIATIQAFGSNKEGENVFQLESFKQPAFINATKGRSLVIIGYSGSDDFDIVPTLMVLKNLKNVIWINYTPNDGGKEKIYEIDDAILTEPEMLDKINSILKDIYKIRNANRIYRVDVNTTRLLEEFLDTKPKISSDKFSLNPMNWLKTNINPPDEYKKYFIPYEIYDSFDIQEDAMRCSDEILRIAEEEGNKKWKSLALNNIATIHSAQGNYPEALKRYEETLKISEQLGDISGKATVLNNIASIYHDQGSYSEALEKYEEALKIAEQLGDISGKAYRLNNIGLVYDAQGNYPEALKRYEEALKIDEQLGDLSGKATALNNIASIYKTQGNYPEALKKYEEALKIVEQLGDLSGKAAFLNNIASIYGAQGKHPEALKRYEEALKIDEHLGDLSGKAACFNNIASIYKAQGNHPEALKRYEEALNIDEHLGDLSGKAIRLNNIATIYYEQCDYPEALKKYEEALNIDEHLGDLSGKATDLNNIASIYKAQGKYPEALKRYEEALKIDEQLGELSGKATRLNNIASIHYEQGNYPEALKRYEEALKIDEYLGDPLGKAADLNNIASIHYEQGNYPEALRLFEESLQILIDLGLSDSPNAKAFKENIEYLKSIMK